MAAILGCAAGCATGNRVGTAEAEADISSAIHAAIDAPIQAGTNRDQSRREIGDIQAKQVRVTQSTTDAFLNRALAIGLIANLALTIYLSYPLGRARRLRQLRS